MFDLAQRVDVNESDLCERDAHWNVHQDIEIDQIANCVGGQTRKG